MFVLDADRQGNGTFLPVNALGRRQGGRRDSIRNSLHTERRLSTKRPCNRPGQQHRCQHAGVEEKTKSSTVRVEDRHQETLSLSEESTFSSINEWSRLIYR